MTAEKYAERIIQKFWSITSTSLEEIEHAEPELAKLVQGAIDETIKKCMDLCEKAGEDLLEEQKKYPVPTVAHQGAYRAQVYIKEWMEGEE